MAFAQVVIHLAIAIPFLLLPSCHSLHVVEEGHGLSETLIFGVHHKTGTLLAEEASSCFDSSFNHRVVQHFMGVPLGPHKRVLHLTRDPTSVALSAYIYHRTAGEAWTFEDGGAWGLLKHDTYVKKFLGDRNESYTAFLRRVDALVGIRAEIFRMSLGQLDELDIAGQFCARTSQCLQMCLEDFTVSSSSYDASWRKVLSFMGTDVTPQMHKCLAKDDLNRHPVDTGHITLDLLPEWKYNKLRKIVQYLDAAVFNNTLKKMGEGRSYCGGGYSTFLNALSSSSTDGCKFKEWLIAEQYSRSKARAL